jgi:hypothetical protein
MSFVIRLAGAHSRLQPYACGWCEAAGIPTAFTNPRDLIDHVEKERHDENL